MMTFVDWKQAHVKEHGLVHTRDKYYSLYGQYCQLVRKMEEKVKNMAQPILSYEEKKQQVDRTEKIDPFIAKFQKQHSIFEAVKRERQYQEQKHGGHPHTIAEFIVLMEDELAEAKKGWIKEGNNKALEEILQVVALGFACKEQHGIVERPEIGQL